MMRTFSHLERMQTHVLFFEPSILLPSLPSFLCSRFCEFAGLSSNGKKKNNYNFLSSSFLKIKNDQIQTMA